MADTPFWDKKKHMWVVHTGDDDEAADVHKDVDESTLRQLFEKCDANGDGQIDRSEFIKACGRNKEVADLFKIGTGTKRLSPEQRVAASRAMISTFCSIDENGDGKLTYEELVTFLQEKLCYAGDASAAPPLPAAPASLSSHPEGRPRPSDGNARRNIGPLHPRVYEILDALWTVWDHNGDGVRDWSEYAMVAMAMGEASSLQEAQDQFRALMQKHGGTGAEKYMTRSQHIGWFEKHLATAEEAEGSVGAARIPELEAFLADSARYQSCREVMVAFQKIDRDRNGKISRSELRAVLQALDADCWTERKCDKMFSIMDADNSSEVSIPEFLRWTFSDVSGGRFAHEIAQMLPPTVGRAPARLPSKPTGGDKAAHTQASPRRLSSPAAAAPPPTHGWRDSPRASRRPSEQTVDPNLFSDGRPKWQGEQPAPPPLPPGVTPGGK